MNSYLFLISGPSGSGKSSVINELLKANSSLALLVSCTSRPKRDSEQAGHPYFFMSRAAFEQNIHAGNFLEWKVIHQHHYYGIRKSDIQQHLDADRSLVKDVDILGSFDLRTHFPKRVVPIFISTQNKQDLVERLQLRNESESNIQNRLKRYQIEMLYRNHFLHDIQNIHLEATVKQLTQIIHGYQHSVKEPDLSFYHRIFLSIKNKRNQMLSIQSHQSNTPSIFIPEYQLNNENVIAATRRKLQFVFYPTEVPIRQVKIIQKGRHGNHTSYLVEVDLPSQHLAPLETENFKLQWIPSKTS